MAGTVTGRYYINEFLQRAAPNYGYSLNEPFDRLKIPGRGKTAFHKLSGGGRRLEVFSCSSSPSAGDKNILPERIRENAQRLVDILSAAEGPVQPHDLNEISFLVEDAPGGGFIARAVCPAISSQAESIEIGPDHDVERPDGRHGHAVDDERHRLEATGCEHLSVPDEHPERCLTGIGPSREVPPPEETLVVPPHPCDDRLPELDDRGDLGFKGGPARPSKRVIRQPQGPGNVWGEALEGLRHVTKNRRIQLSWRCWCFTSTSRMSRTEESVASSDWSRRIPNC